MVKESARKCSHCGNNGHNSRTCSNGKGGCLKLFGVNILAEKGEESMRKCKSMGNLASFHREISAVDEGYLSDGPIHTGRSGDTHERKKGVPWTEDEHRAFLAGLDKLGKGDWRGISKNHVPSRTPTQVASHAQKYFIRLTSTERKKRRSSLFDMSLQELENHHFPPPQEPPDKTAEIPPQADKSPDATNLNNFGHTKTQAIGTSAQAASPLDAPPVLPLAASYGLPNFRQMPFMPMVGVSGNGQNFPGPEAVPTVSFVPVMNFPNHGYFYMPKSYGNYATCAPYLSQTSGGGLLPQPLFHGPSHAGPLNLSG